ncbi:MAG: choice-of-anchor J domain-containing protein [Phycisphaerae bacterium]|nr:choice-of-anchor J domain-containing protein [Phycisphaerae bacterium]
MKIRIALGLTGVLIAAPALADLTVGQNLGTLGAGTISLTGDTSGLLNNCDYYDGPVGAPFLESGPEYVYQFTLASTMIIEINQNLTVAPDHDHFLLDSLVTTWDGTYNRSNNSLGFVDESGLLGQFDAGTYFLSVDGYNGDEGAYDFDLILAEPPEPPEYLLLEDFNAGIPANWTILDNIPGGGPFVWMTNDVAGRENYAGGDGLCADADSDEFGASGTPYDTSLITPEFMVPADAEFMFTAAYNDLGAGGDTAEVNVTTDGGTTWTNLLTWDEDHDPAGPGELVNIDFGGYAGETAQVEFRYYGGGWDWYFQVDNVGLTPEPASLMLLALGALLRRR